MHVMRDNKDSVMAMLEAFVYDPLISWRLLVRPDGENATSENGEVEDENRMRNDSLIIDPEVTYVLAIPCYWSQCNGDVLYVCVCVGTSVIGSD